jgi:hypothetical protein
LEICSRSLKYAPVQQAVEETMFILVRPQLASTLIKHIDPDFGRHPNHSVRLQEAQRFCTGGQYQRKVRQQGYSTSGALYMSL